MKKSNWIFLNRMVRMAVTAACILVLTAGSVFAAAHFLNPGDVAHELGDAKLERAFRSGSAVYINETQSFRDYDVTLLGMISGRDLSNGKVEANEGEFHPDRTYVALAIERKDGKTIGDGDSFFITPLIDGYERHDLNIAMLLGGYSAFYSDDMKTEYTIIDMDNIEPFADHSIHIAAMTGDFCGGEGSFIQSGGPYNYNAATGAYSRMKDFDGVNALFDLPIDPAKADPTRAEQILKEARER